MRISTSSFFDSAISRLGDLQSSLARTQQQIAAGRKILSPSDNPIAASDALKVTEAQAANNQLAVNRQTAKAALGLEEGVLQNVTTLLQDVKTLMVGAGNGALEDEQRSYYATELRAQIDQLLGYANFRDGNSNYVFAGFLSGSQPFIPTATGATYVGDQGQRNLQVGSSRQISLSDPGSSVFEGARTGNGLFVTAAGAGNTGAGIVSPGSVADPAQLPAREYDIVFTSATTYDITDLTAVPTVTTSGTYVSGLAIVAGAIQFDIAGEPAAGDTFSVRPSSSQSIFTTLTNLVNVLEASATGPAGQARLTNGLNTAQNNLDNTLDKVLQVRASVGARLREVDALDNEGADRELQYAQALVDLQDLDYTKAISELTKNQITLEAAQKSFIQASGLSLFNFIS